MVLPLYLAMNASEINTLPTPERCAWMACHFSPWGCGISNLPDTLPPASMLILNDRLPCQGHSPGLIADQILEAVSRMKCESLLLDLQRPDNPETAAVVSALLDTLPCSVAVSECYAAGRDCPVFLPPAPLHIPAEEYLAPWQNQTIWMEAGLCQERITVTEAGTAFSPQFPLDIPEGGFWDEGLHCQYHTAARESEITFTLFDTPESLPGKLEQLHCLGVSRFVGLFQELGTFLTG